MTATKETKHGTIIVDDCDADLLEGSHPTAATNAYVKRYIAKGVKKYLHRLILSRVLGRELVLGEQVDHVDGNGLNNVRANLRLATHAQNQHNRRLQSNNSTGFKGVIWRKDCKRYQAFIKFNNKRKHIGYFDNPADAHAAYMAAAREYFGEFANSGKGE